MQVRGEDRAQGIPVSFEIDHTYEVRGLGYNYVTHLFPVVSVYNPPSVVLVRLLSYLGLKFFKSRFFPARLPV